MVVMVAVGFVALTLLYMKKQNMYDINVIFVISLSNLPKVLV